MKEGGIEWAAGVCIDGPLEGKKLYCTNRVGCVVTHKAGTIGPTLRYRVVELAHNDHPARLAQAVDE